MPAYIRIYIHPQHQDIGSRRNMEVSLSTAKRSIRHQLFVLLAIFFVSFKNFQLWPLKLR